MKNLYSFFKHPKNRKICEIIFPLIILFLMSKIGFWPVWILMIIGIIIYYLCTTKNKKNESHPIKKQSKAPNLAFGLAFLIMGILFLICMYQSVNTSLLLLLPVVFISIGCILTFIRLKIIFQNIHQGNLLKTLENKIKQISQIQWIVVLGLAWFPAFLILYLIQPGQLYCNRSENICYLQKIKWGISHTYRTIPLDQIQQATLKTEIVDKTVNDIHQREYIDQIILETTTEEIDAPWASTNVSINGKGIHSDINQQRINQINQFLHNSNEELLISGEKFFLLLSFVFFVLGCAFLFG